MAKSRPKIVGAHRFATVNEVADYLKTTTRTVHNMILDRRLTAYRGLGSKMLRIDLNEVDAVIAGDGGDGNDAA